MGDIRIKVGASLDTRARDVFKPVVESARKAKAEIDKVFRNDARNAIASFERNLERALAKLDRGMTKALPTGDLERFGREAERTFDRVGQAAQRAFADIPRLPRGGGGGGVGYTPRRGYGGRSVRDSFAERTGYWSMRYFDNTMRSGAHFANRMANAAGFDFNLGSMVAGIQERDNMIQTLSNASWTARSSKEEKAAAQPGAILKDVKSISDSTATDRFDTIAGLQRFVGMTGDLDTARKVMADMARLSKATGSSMEDMMDAAAQVSGQLQPSADKAKIIYQTMRAIAGQGQVGAVEIKDMAKQMTRLAVIAKKFAVGKDTQQIFERLGIEDDQARGVAVLGGMAQMARQHGKASPRQAVHAAEAFIRDLSNKTSLTRIQQEAGIKIFDDKGNTILRDPKRLIMDILAKTKGDQTKLTHMMSNENSRSMVLAYGGFFNDAYKKRGNETDAERLKRALKAVSDEYDKMLEVTMSENEVGEKFKASMDQTVSKTIQFKSKLQDVAEKVSNSMLPAFDRLAPKLLEATDAFAKVVAWAADNPGKAITAAIVASIVRAGVENALRAAVETAIRGGGGMGGGGGGLGFRMPALGAGGAGGGALNAGYALGAAFTIATLSVATVQVGKMLIDEYYDKKNKEEGTRITTELNEYSKSLHARGEVASGGGDKNTLKALQDEASSLAEKKAKNDAQLNWLNAVNVKNDPAHAEERAAALKAQKELQDATKANTDAMKALTLRLLDTVPGEGASGLLGNYMPRTTTDFSSDPDTYR